MRGISLKNWRWIERGVVPFLSAAMRVAWIAPLVRFLLGNTLVGPEGLTFPWYVMMAILLGASLLERIVQEHPRGQQMVAITGLGVVAVSVIMLYQVDAGSVQLWFKMLIYDLTSFADYFPGALIIIIATAFLWRRGLTIDWQSYEQLFKSFIIGTVILALLVLIAPTEAWSKLNMSPWISLGIFVSTSLMALGLLGAQEATRTRGDNDVPMRPSRYWLGVVLSVIAGIGILGFLVSRIASPEGIQELSRLLSPIMNIIKQGLSYVLLAIAYFVFWILGPLLERLEENYAQNFEEVARQVSESLEQDLSDLQPVATEPNMALQRALQILLLTAIVVGLVILFYTAFKRRRKKKSQRIGEERESVLSSQLLETQIRELLQNLRRKPRLAPFLQLDGISENRRRIRLAYQRFLSRMAKRSQARPAGTTPNAYARKLAKEDKEERQALDDLTNAYDLARYSNEEPDESIARRAEEAESSIN